ncbi:hypothetical protein BCV69DRAFT_298841 [Microstroma glucosiphilum]|uniref:Uncharacterized protein n=1 Tax=Pseudomicrostroma glucosiphilum TaxID=1684307 RepID=A0A316U738_9BASI|nr:hypothetical protein BCV69DRAFT_298841 [Pseudomicrostroma glucosiphilum]PWN21050.1 hypothetical protein BCV69DRAFT_298841 [Pseudomicrostroma glucosiphilum]
MLIVAKPTSLMHQGPRATAEGCAPPSSSDSASTAALNSTVPAFTAPALPALTFSSPLPVRPSFQKATSHATKHEEKSSRRPALSGRSISNPRPAAHSPPKLASAAPPLSKRAVTFDAPSRTVTPHPPGFMPSLRRDSSDATAGVSIPPTHEANVAEFSRGAALRAPRDPNLLSLEELSPGSRSHALPASDDPSSSRTMAFQTHSQASSFGEYDVSAPDSGAGTKSIGATSAFSTGPKGPRKRRRPAPPELLIIVRPPPSKDRNPLNLQIQLVVPTTCPPSRTSGESVRDSSFPISLPTASASSGSPREPLQRRGSSASSHSARSEMTTASSASGGTSASRKVTPLYNLAVHSIMPTTVSDAGTDQRVAKFTKKGAVEIDDFGILEPRELIFGLNDIATLEGTDGPRAMAGPDGEVSANRHDREADDTGTVASADVQPPTSFEAMTPEARSPELVSPGAKLMKRFKGLQFGSKSTGSGSGSVGAGSSSASTTTQGVGAFLNGLGVSTSKSTRQSTADSTRPVSVAGLSLVSGLSAAAAAKSSGFKPGVEVLPLVPGAGLSEHGARRSQGYVWTIAKLTRRVADDEGNLSEAPLDVEGQNQVLKSVWRHFNSANKLGGDERHPHPQRIPVRFEWTREGRHGSFSPAKSTVSPDRRRPGPDGVSAAVAKRMSVQSGDFGPEIIGRHEAEAAAPTGDSLRLPAVDSRTRPHSASRSLSRDASRSNPASPRPSSDAKSLRGSSAPDEDDEDFSDPEDSEEPWSCHLVLSGSTRIPIGTLSPAPHHPKIVAQLAVPFPLPDLSHTGLCADGAGLTREEIKDVICVSALHLMMRESFGGLGRVRKRTGSNKQ